MVVAVEKVDQQLWLEMVSRAQELLSRGPPWHARRAQAYRRMRERSKDLHWVELLLRSIVGIRPSLDMVLNHHDIWRVHIYCRQILPAALDDMRTDQAKELGQVPWPVV